MAFTCIVFFVLFFYLEIQIIKFNVILLDPENSTEQTELNNDGDEDTFDDSDTDPTWYNKRQIDNLVNNNSDIDHEEPSSKRKFDFDMAESNI